MRRFWRIVGDVLLLPFRALGAIFDAIVDPDRR